MRVTAEIAGVSDKAIGLLLYYPRTRREEVIWLPKSRVKIRYLPNNQADVVIPDWLAKKKGLMEGTPVRESILESTRAAIDLGRSPTVESLEADYLAGFENHKTKKMMAAIEAKDPPKIKQFRKIVKTKSFGKVDGTPVDLFSASAVTQVYDALSKPSNQRKYANMDPVEMISMAYKLINKGRRAATSRETSEGQADWRGKPFLPALQKAVKAYDATVKVQGKKATIKVPTQSGKMGAQLAKDLVSDLGKDNPEYFWKTKNAVARGDTVTVKLPAEDNETSQAGAGVLNALAQAIMGKGAPLRPQGNAQVARSQEAGESKIPPQFLSKQKKRKVKEAAGKLKMFRKASGNQPDVYQVLNPSGGVEGFVEKLPDTSGVKNPFKAFGRTYGGKPGRGKHLGDFKNKNAAMAAVMKAGG